VSLIRERRAGFVAVLSRVVNYISPPVYFNYICKCKVNVNVPKCRPFTLLFRGLLFAFYIIACNYIFGCNPCFHVGFLEDPFPNSSPTRISDLQ
jgi:hypothetical protein